MATLDIDFCWHPNAVLIQVLCVVGPALKEARGKKEFNHSNCWRIVISISKPVPHLSVTVAKLAFRFLELLLVHDCQL